MAKKTYSGTYITDQKVNGDLIVSYPPDFKYRFKNYRKMSSSARDAIIDRELMAYVNRTSRAPHIVWNGGKVTKVVKPYVAYGTLEYWSAKIAAKQAALRAGKETAASKAAREAIVTLRRRLATEEEVAAPPPTEKNGFLNWLMGTPLWTPFKTTPTPPTAPPTTPPLPTNGAVVECLQGLMYDKPLMFGCDAGYIPYDPGIGQKELCMCTARYEEAMGILKPIEPDKTARDVGLGGLGSIVDMLPAIIIGGIVIAAMGMLKK